MNAFRTLRLQTEKKRLMPRTRRWRTIQESVYNLPRAHRGSSRQRTLSAAFRFLGVGLVPGRHEWGAAARVGTRRYTFAM